MGGSFKKLAEQANFSVGRIENVVFLHWKQVPSVAALEPLEQAFQIAVANTGPDKFGFFTLMEEETLAASTPVEVRNGIGALLKRYNDLLSATTIVFEGSGLKASIIRGMITAINLMSRSTFPSSVHNDYRAGAEWLATRLGPKNKLQALDLMHVVDELRGKQRGPMFKAS